LGELFHQLSTKKIIFGAILKPAFYKLFPQLILNPVWDVGGNNESQTRSKENQENKNMGKSAFDVSLKQGEQISDHNPINILTIRANNASHKRYSVEY
jgi:hypothetical protein